MTISLPQKSLSQSIMGDVFPYLDEDMGGLPASTGMLYGFFTAAHTLSASESYDHPLLLKAVVHIALNHPRYQACRELTKNSPVFTSLADFNISNIVKYYLQNGDFVLDRNLDLNNPAQVIEAFQCAYRSKKIDIFKNKIYRCDNFKFTQEFRTLKDLLCNDDRFLLRSACKGSSIVEDPSYEILRSLKNIKNMDFGLTMVRINPKVLKYMTKNIVLQAVSKDSRAVRCSSRELRADRRLFLRFVKLEGTALQHVTPELQGDREVVLAAVSKDGYALPHASGELQADREVVLAAVRQNGDALQYVIPKFKTDREIVLAAVRQYGHALQHVTPKLQEDREIVLDAVKETGIALQHVTPKLQEDREIVLAAVRQHGFALKYASPKLQVDREFILEAVRQNNDASKVLSCELRGDREFVLAAVKQKSFGLQYVIPEFKADREIVLAAVRNNGIDLYFANPELQGDQEIVLAAVRQNGYALKYATPKLQANQDCILEAAKNKGLALQQASQKLKAAQEIVLEVASSDEDALQQASQELKAVREIVLDNVDLTGYGKYYIIDFSCIIPELRTDRKVLMRIIRKLTPSESYCFRLDSRQKEESVKTIQNSDLLEYVIKSLLGRDINYQVRWEFYEFNFMNFLEVN